MQARAYKNTHFRRAEKLNFLKAGKNSIKIRNSCVWYEMGKVKSKHENREFIVTIFRSPQFNFYFIFASFSFVHRRSQNVENWTLAGWPLRRIQKAQQ